jgi:hypothetical protein
MRHVAHSDKRGHYRGTSIDKRVTRAPPDRLIAAVSLKASVEVMYACARSPCSGAFAVTQKKTNSVALSPQANSTD